MNRVEVIKKIIKKNDAKNYLEIGVEYGTLFFRIKAKNKIAIDPCFKFSFKKKLYKIFFEKNSNFFKMTSDDFFNKNNNLFLNKKIDVAFIDGLHTYEQSLRDVKNCLNNLDDNGVIVVHDCNPLSEAAANRSQSEAKKMKDWNGKWNGNVWKTIACLRSNRDDLNIFVLNCDQGIGIITKGKPENMLSYKLEEIKDMGYKYFNNNRNEILNLKSEEYLDNFLKDLNKRNFVAKNVMENV